MTEIKLWNTATKSKGVLAPLDAKNVRMYVCGPTVYDRAHIGNARPVVVFDVLFRLLRHVYGADHVTYVRNFTDVDDKINDEALRRQKAGAAETLEELIHQRTEETIDWYHADMDELEALRPSIKGEVTDKATPRATEYIKQMVAMIEGLLINKNDDGIPYAYVKEGHVLFRVKAYKSYGALSGRSVDDMIAGARVEVAPFKEDPMDFVLWKPSDADQPGWDGPKVDGKSIGRGRPGWHIECSAMADALLGESFDIHGGGLDLQFPHHENEIAQSACAHPHGEFARVWMHNEMLQVEGKKMSKSLGNFFTVRDLLDKGYPGVVIRYVLLSTHYRSPMDWTAEKASEAASTLRNWAMLVNKRPAITSPWNVVGDLYDSEIVDALASDLNTPAAITRLHALYKLARPATNEGNSALAKLFHSARDLLGIDLEVAYDALRPKTIEDKVSDMMLAASYHSIVNREVIDNLVAFRALAKANRDFDTADKIRDDLATAGVVLTDKSGETVWEIGADFDSAKIEALK